MNADKNQNGFVNPLTIALVVTTLLMALLGATTIIFYGRYTDHRDNVDAKVAEAVEAAKTQQAEELNAEFQEELKKPNKTYTSPSALGSIEITYPRTWGAYIIEDEGGRTGLDGYFHPGYVPDVRSDTRFAVRMTLDNESYADAVDGYDRDVEDGSLNAKAITINDVKGVRFDGDIDRDVNGSLVVLPLRDKTLKIWTENPDNKSDFESIILENLKFNP